ncbi:DUF6298 domain-containing protein [Actinocrispum sp. NPDC049592]|uniref:DUF6298 domain-containing protein n=1 Tax=Actinocrispum sp. NPDC049592 TaxID=3154835 RepID=UPI0034384A7B
MTAPLGPLRAQGRYFATPDGHPVLLTGSHTWQNFQDTGFADPPSPFDYSAYLDLLQRNNHNFFRLWVWEQARYSVEISSDDYFTSPSPYARTGPGTALDGKPRFNLDRFDQAYFDRLSDRVRQASARGMYVSVMLFDGWSIAGVKGEQHHNNPWKGHPFNAANNINGVNGDPNRNGSGEETQTLQSPTVTARQEAYVQKVIDTLADDDNVLFEISNEGPPNSVQWQYHMISYIKSHDRLARPVGMTSTYPDGDNQDLWDSPADWISPNGDIDNPPVTSGAKVVLSDTDHLCGLCGDREWPWKSFTRGENPIYMDAYDGAYGIGGDIDDPNAIAIRANLGYVRKYATRMNLAEATPQPGLSSTKFCLAAPDEYLFFSPSNTFVIHIDPRGLTGEWFEPRTGETVPADITGDHVTAPFRGPAVLYLKR